jgi:DNA-binding SARP family transcriptional activator
MQVPELTRLEVIVERCERALRMSATAADNRLVGVVEAMLRIAMTCEDYVGEAERHRYQLYKVHERKLQLFKDLELLTTFARAKREESGHAEITTAAQNLATDPASDASNAEIALLIEEVANLLRLDPVETPDSTVGTVCAGPPNIGRSVPDTCYGLSGSHTAGIVPPRFEGHSENAAVTAACDAPSLEVYLLCPFQVLLDGEPVSGWPNCRGKAIFKYLIAHRRRPIPKEVLMDTFWPDADPDCARNNLNVAVYGLRKILASVNASVSYVLFQDNHYLLNPDVAIWVDSEAFMEHVRRGKDLDRKGDRASAIAEYRAADTIYQGELLIDDRYEDWLLDLRQQFQDAYQHALEQLGEYHFTNGDYDFCIAYSGKILAVDACNEGAHRRLMRCYSRLGQPHLVVRQYRQCMETLSKELQLSPSQETRQLFMLVRAGQAI